jgi:hypothetical protein
MKVLKFGFVTRTSAVHRAAETNCRTRSRSSTGRTELRSVIARSGRLTSEGMQAEFAKVLEHVFEHIPEKRYFLVHAGAGWEPGIVGGATIGDGIVSPAGFALRRGLPVIFNHLDTEKRYRTPEVLARHGIRRAMNVILQGKDRPFGVLEGQTA